MNHIERQTVPDQETPKHSLFAGLCSCVTSVRTKLDEWDKAGERWWRNLAYEESRVSDGPISKVPLERLREQMEE